MLRFIVVLGTLLTLTLPPLPGREREGVRVQAQEYLGEELAPRAWGLGGAFVGIADDISAVYWNPAGLGGLRGTRFWGRLSLPATGTPFEIEAAAISGWLSGFGISAWYGQKRFLQTDPVREEALTLIALGLDLSNAVAAGASVKLYDEKREGQRWQGTGLDLGGLLRWGRLLQGGLVMTDLLGTKLKTTESDQELELARIVRMGILVRLWEEQLAIAAALDLAQQEELRRIRLGAELRLLGSLAIRVGWNGRELVWGAGAGIWNLLQAEFSAQAGGWAFSVELVFGGT